MPTPLKFKPRPSRVKTAIESALETGQYILMFVAASIVLLMLAQLNATATAAAIRTGEMPLIVTYMP